MKKALLLCVLMLLSMWKINKRQTYQAPEDQLFTRLKILGWAVLCLLSIFALLIGFFLYKNIYNTVGTAEQLIMQNSNLSSVEIIDFDLFEKVKKLWDEKNNPPALELKRDPFNAISATSTKR